MAEEIERIRKDQGISQNQLAKMAKMSQAKLNRATNYEDADLNLSTFIRVAAALNHRVALVPDPPKK